MVKAIFIILNKKDLIAYLAKLSTIACHGKRKCAVVT